MLRLCQNDYPEDPGNGLFYCFESSCGIVAIEVSDEFYLDFFSLVGAGVEEKLEAFMMNVGPARAEVSDGGSRSVIYNDRRVVVISEKQSVFKHKVN